MKLGLVAVHEVAGNRAEEESAVGMDGAGANVELNYAVTERSPGVLDCSRPADGSQDVALHFPKRVVRVDRTISADGLPAGQVAPVE